MRFQSYISGFLRKLRLLRMAEKVRFRLQQIKYSRQNKLFRKKHPGLALPPDFYIYETYRLDLGEYYHDGLITAREIIDGLNRYIDFSRPGVTILDWGCGPGRIVRHLPELIPGSFVFGTDYNKKYIKWCNSNLSDIDFSLSGIDPPTNYKEAFFDVVIGISVFTHLSGKNHSAWINELYRIVKSGGIVLLTTQGCTYRSRLLPEELAKFDRGELVVRENIQEGNRLFSAFQPPVYIEKLVKNQFEIIGFETSKDKIAVQDTWVLRKTG